MICKECGNKIDDNSTFCKFCGYKVSAESSCQKAYLNTPTENSSAIKSKQVKKNIIISLSSIITVLTAIVLITVIIKIHNKQENIVTDDDLSKTEIGSGVTDNAIKSKSAKSITDSNTNVEIESEKTDSNNKTYESIEFIGIDNYDDWSAANFYDTDGNEVEYIDNKYFSDFEETGCSITVTLKYLNTDYYVFAPKDAVDWNALYKLDGNYITGDLRQQMQSALIMNHILFQMRSVMTLLKIQEHLYNQTVFSVYLTLSLRQFLSIFLQKPYLI